MEYFLKSACPSEISNTSLAKFPPVIASSFKKRGNTKEVTTSASQDDTLQTSKNQNAVILKYSFEVSPFIRNFHGFSRNVSTRHYQLLQETRQLLPKKSLPLAPQDNTLYSHLKNPATASLSCLPTFCDAETDRAIKSTPCFSQKSTTNFKISLQKCPGREVKSEKCDAQSGRKVKAVERVAMMQRVASDCSWQPRLCCGAGHRSLQSCEWDEKF